MIDEKRKRNYNEATKTYSKPFRKSFERKEKHLALRGRLGERRRDYGYDKRHFPGMRCFSGDGQ